MKRAPAQMPIRVQRAAHRKTAVQDPFRLHLLCFRQGYRSLSFQWKYPAAVLRMRQRGQEKQTRRRVLHSRRPSMQLQAMQLTVLKRVVLLLYDLSTVSYRFRRKCLIRHIGSGSRTGGPFSTFRRCRRRRPFRSRGRLRHRRASALQKVFQCTCRLHRHAAA